MRIRSIVFSMVVVTSSVSIAACGGGETTGDQLPACPTAGTELTYDSFGRDFFGKYCTSCHSVGSGVTEAEAQPYESQDQIKADIMAIYEQAGGTNDAMPQSGDKPTATERTQLAEWLSCGAE